MDHALAVVDPTDGAKQLVREAGELAAGVGADLTLLHVTTEEEFNDKAAAMARIPEADASYTQDRAEEGGRQFVRDVAREVLDDVDVAFDAVGEVGDRVDTILDEAAERDCDHIFVAGRKRSPAGKAIFGDVAQTVVLEFDGAVTIITQ
ncbi:MAG: universal stress protein [Halodesulfurarchaeum sp.]